MLQFVVSLHCPRPEAAHCRADDIRLHFTCKYAVKTQFKNILWQQKYIYLDIQMYLDVEVDILYRSS